MQVTEVSADGLKREYRVVVPADDIERRVQGRLQDLSKKVRMPGFRPGKVPVNLLRKQYGASVMGEVIEEAVNQGSQTAISQHELKPALKPKVEITRFDQGADLEFTMAVEVLPEVPAVDYGAIRLTRLKAEVADEAVDGAVRRFAEAQREYGPPEEPRPAREGDRLTVDFTGRIDGEEFEGGSATDFHLVLGSGGLLPGFDEQLTGVEAGTTKPVEVTFPEGYGRAELAGKAATFDVAVKEVQEPKPVEVDEEFAKRIGFEDLEKLRAAFRERMEREYGQLSRARLKRALLDHLAEGSRFEVPQGMVDLEFEAIWRQLTAEMERTGQTFEQSGKTEEQVRDEYRAIAERRVRLGLILSDIGRQNNLSVEPQELQAALLEQARQYPGREREFLEFVRNNPQVQDQLRAPIFEDKVVDFILQLATVEEQVVPVEELLKDPDEEEAAAGGEDATPAAAG
ncbi:MAG TPA: trigger factor [Thermoanaerobaculia bacterium]|nr:trigger factor [Thermoanaerobaculia bacterium]